MAKAQPRFNGKRLPKRCDCGGRIEYAFSFNRVWSVCPRCAPVTVIKWGPGGTLAGDPKRPAQ